jgi:hypothetical protein
VEYLCPATVFIGSTFVRSTFELALAEKKCVKRGVLGGFSSDTLIVPCAYIYIYKLKGFYISEGNAYPSFCPSTNLLTHEPDMSICYCLQAIGAFRMRAVCATAQPFDQHVITAFFSINPINLICWLIMGYTDSSDRYLGATRDI